MLAPKEPQLRLRKRFLDKTEDTNDGTHPRDIAIVIRVAEGDTSAEIAIKSNISTRTVEAIIAGMCKKYECKSRSQLVAKFFREGWIC